MNKGNEEIITFTDEYLDFVYDNSSKINISKDNKSKKVFPLDEPEYTSGRAAGRFTPSKDTDFKL